MDLRGSREGSGRCDACWAVDGNPGDSEVKTMHHSEENVEICVGLHARRRRSIEQRDRQYGFARLRRSAYVINIGPGRILAGIRVGTAFTPGPAITAIPGCGHA